MQDKVSPQCAFDHFVQQTEQALDAVVDTGTDQQLFIASYLHGHFSLLVAQLLQQQGYTIDRLDALVQQSLASAFAAQELEPADQQQVLALWSSLRIQADG